VLKSYFHEYLQEKTSDIVKRFIIVNINVNSRHS